MVAWTRLSVALYVNWLYCYVQCTDRLQWTQGQAESDVFYLPALQIHDIGGYSVGGR